MILGLEREEGGDGEGEGDNGELSKVCGCFSWGELKFAEEMGVAYHLYWVYHAGQRSHRWKRFLRPGSMKVLQCHWWS